MQGHQKTWDETRSPQWKYLLSKENRQRKLKREVWEENTEREGEGKQRNKKSRKAKQLRKEERAVKKLSKSGKEIIYTASPGNTHGGYGRFHSADMDIMKEMKSLKNNVESDKTT